MEQPKTLIVPLKTGLQYSVGGDFETANELIFKAPAYAQMDLAFALEEYLARAFTQASKVAQVDDQAVDKPQVDDAPAITGNDIKLLLMNGPDSYSAALSAFSKIAPMVCDVDVDVKLKKEHVKTILANDFKEWGDIMCKYLAFFIAPSFLAGLEA